MQEQKQGHLVRSLGLFSVFMLVVSSVIGSGIYKKIAPMSAYLQAPIWVLICWILAGIVTVCGALSNAEVAGLLADSGGEYVYYRKIYNKFFAFLFGWSNFTAIRSASAASIAYVFAQSLDALVKLPVLSEHWSSISLFGIFTPFDNIGVKLVAIVLIIVLSFINYRGLKLGEGVSKIVLIIVVISIVFIIVAGLTVGGGSWSHFQAPATGYVPVSLLDKGFLSGIFAALLAAFWAYEGWSPIGYLGGEIKNPHRNLPLALIFGVLFVMLVYVTINFTYLYVLPIDHFISVYHSKNSIAAVEVVKSFSGAAGVLGISLLILLTTFGATNTTLLPPPRLYYAMAKEGVFFRGASYIHPRFNTPSKAIVYQACWACVLVMSGSFDQLTDMLIFASFIFYGATTLGVFVLRVKMPDVPRPYKAWGYPVVPALFILFCIGLIVVTLVTKPREAGLGLALMASGIPFYLYWSGKNNPN
jgi:basic amino acid/polyamine antiporter, APA family